MECSCMTEKAYAKEEIYELIRKAQDGDEYAQEEMISRNTGLVKSIALKYTSLGYETDDLMQLGYMGLIKAVKNFNTEYDVMFSTYAVPMIAGEIRRFVRDDGRVKVSRRIKSDLKRMKAVREELLLKCAASPKLSVIAERMDITMEYLLELMEAEEALCSCESMDDSENIKQYAESRGGSQFEREEQLVDMICLKSIMGKLDEKERKIIVLRYFKDMTQQQTAGILGISQVQVSRIEKRVLGTMRSAYRAEG
ncbi:MAG: sigma-70 family RNA polymerase sigma factor [Anaerovoracaceae bacterium]